MKTLAGKKALVTGASRGIGRAIAIALAAEGADVAITYEKSADAAKEVVKEIEKAGQKGVAIAANSANADAVKKSIKETVDSLGGLDILVNNAGIIANGTFEEMKIEDLDKILNVNIRAVVLASQAAIPHLKEGGRIINIGSCLAERVSWPGLSVYSMTKSALISLTKGLARDLGARGITVNIVHPGPIDTDMNPADSEFAKSQVGMIALGHYGKPEDVADAVTFLAGPGAKQITGTGLVVDGGVNA